MFLLPNIGSVPLHNDSQDFLSQSQRFDEYEKTGKHYDPQIQKSLFT